MEFILKIFKECGKKISSFKNLDGVVYVSSVFYGLVFCGVWYWRMWGELFVLL